MGIRGSGDPTAVVAIIVGTALAVWLLPSAVASTHEAEPASRGAMVASETAAPEVELMASAGGVAFYASSLDGGWGLEGDYGGRLSFDGQNLRVVLSSAFARAAATGGDAPHLQGIRLALAEETAQGWRIVSEGPMHRLDRALQEGETLDLRGMSLVLPDLVESELADRWLVIVHELREDGPAGWSTAWTYTHADRELIPRLMGWVEDGC